jgi:hypothetical protein
VTNEVQTCHTSRLKFYCDSDLDISCELEAVIAEDEAREDTYEVEAIRDIQFDSVAGQFMALIAWKGYDEEEQTWELLSEIFSDIPECVLSSIERMPARKAARIRQALGIIDE